MLYQRNERVSHNTEKSVALICVENSGLSDVFYCSYVLIKTGPFKAAYIFYFNNIFTSNSLFSKQIY